jgi:uncharacterized phiE125 gp8 family phage protein
MKAVRLFIFALVFFPMTYFSSSQMRTITPADSRPRWALKQVTDATVEPVSLADAKAHMSVTDGTDDAYIPLLIKAARRRLENEMQRALIQQTWRFTLDHFPWFHQRAFPVGFQPIVIPRPPMIDVDSIKYMDPTDPTGQTLITLNANTYLVDSDSEPARIQSTNNSTWPATLRQMGAVQIQYKSGYDDDGSTVPEEIKMAIKQVVAHSYENRESVVVSETRAVIAEVPQTALWLIEPYIIQHFWEQ